MEVHGLGLHRGEATRVRLRPAPVNHGRIFLVQGVQIPATVQYVVDTRLATTLGTDGVRVGMVEHLCAALYACGVDNVVIEVDGGEVPVLDGSARLWVNCLQAAGLRAQGAPRQALRLDAPVRVEHQDSWIELHPHPALHLEVGVHFDHPSIGTQRWQGSLPRFQEELSWARTFGFYRDAQALRAAGLARGASLENTLVYADEGAMDAARASDEVVRHKALDIVGDLALLGRPVHGQLRAWKAGHALHLELVRRLSQLG